MTDCIFWEGFVAKNGYGYGYDFRTKKMRLAHRLAWESKNKDVFLSRSEVIMHLCDNPRCVNTEHLQKGSQKENLEDCRNKKRHMHGEKHTSAKLDFKKVILIRKIYGSNLVSENDLGYLCGLSQSSIHDVIVSKTWEQEPIEKCTHPADKVKGSITQVPLDAKGAFDERYIYPTDWPVEIYQCECGAKLRPKTFEEIT